VQVGNDKFRYYSFIVNASYRTMGARLMAAHIVKLEQYRKD